MPDLQPDDTADVDPVDADTGAATADTGVDESSLPRRDLRDPAELRALAHPVRLAILEQLMQHGSATATELAEQLQDESPANCSWHLRQLARYGFIEEAGTGPGRQRRWRIVLENTSFGCDDEEEPPELARASDMASEVMLDREIAALRTWRAFRRAEPQQWRDASVYMQSWAWLTAEEMAAFQADLGALLERHIFPRLDRIDPAQRPAGARPARMVAWLIPSGQETPEKEPES